MKKILCLFLVVLILCPVLLLPAAAVESEEYVFEYMEPVMTLDDDYDGSYDNGRYVFDGLVPEGWYQMVLTDYSGNVFTSPSFYYQPSRDYFVSTLLFSDIRYDSSENTGGRLGATYARFSESYILDSYYTTMYFSDSVGGNLTASSGLAVTLVSSLSPTSLSLVGSLEENPTGLFLQIISLLPIVLPVLVGYVGIRKAISFVRSKVSEA